MSIILSLLKLKKTELCRAWVKLNCHLWPDCFEKPFWYDGNINGLTDRDIKQRKLVIHITIMNEIECLVGKSSIKYFWRKKSMFI